MLCRCCLSEDAQKDIFSVHIWCNNKEVYSVMLNECFNIALTRTPVSSAICELCITTLRSSLGFKQQVIKAQKELLRTLTDTKQDDVMSVEVKVETKHFSEDDSDDYFLADALPTQKEIKKESETPVKKVEQKRSRGKKKVASDRRPDKVKAMVKRLAKLPNIAVNTVNDSREPDNIKGIKNAVSRKILIKYTSKRATDKVKHKENLQTILKFSNAIPFKDKSLLGFICGYCDATYPDPADLRKHTEVDHKKERLDFKTNFDMTEYNVKLDVNELICTLCDEKMDNLGIFKGHLIKNHNKNIYNDIKDHMLQFKLKKGEVYDCAMCTSTYETFKMLKQHMNKHYCNYTCSKCDTSFATKRSLNAHRNTHQDGNFKCDHCEKVFSSRSKKHYHEKTKHYGERNISNCPYCNEPFRSYYQRNQHLVKVHNSEAQYKCNVCSKAYILKSLLMYHIKKNHLMERNCQCTECGYRFFSNKALKAHMVKHTGERIYSCEVCHKSYARKYTLREHMRIHNNDRRFKCDVCSMTFVQKCSLKSHLLSNHGISMAASDITSS